MTTADRLVYLSNKELLELYERMSCLAWYDPDGQWEVELHPKGYHLRDLSAVRSEVYARMCGPKL